ncbi:MAG: DUF2971 domain-containing protein [Terriglobales bacterium]|jgi:hypothetical protein
MATPFLDSLLPERPRAPLYHYTTPAGLIGIVESKSLWASGIQYLNDTAEYKHATSLAMHLLRQKLENDRDPWNDLCRMILKGEPFYQDRTVFVGSLSEAKDKLSQWRAYCPNGGGFSIGFAPELIERQARKQGFELLKCQYEPIKQEAICAKLIAYGCTAAEKIQADDLRGRPVQPERNEKDDQKSAQTAGIFLGFVEPLMHIAPALKNPSFEEEREWRIVRDLGPFAEPYSNIHFRPGKYAVIPYLEFALAEENSPLDVEEIIIGPSPDPDQTRKSVEYLVNKRGVRCKEIREYSGTYRSW